METTQAINQGNILQGSFLDSQYFYPEYYISHIFVPIGKFLSFLVSPEGRGIENVIFSVFAVFFVTIILYTAVRMLEIRKKEHAHLHHEIEEYAHNQAEQEKRLREETGGSKNVHWSKTLNYLFSQHASDWKLAIIEADTMLEGLMNQLGFFGENLGDRLKVANQENFPQLTTAWEVHTVRNRIAHEGLSFELSHHEAKRIIALYEQIFHAYGYI